MKSGTSAHLANHVAHIVEQALANLISLGLGAAKYMMVMVDAAEDFRSISRACTIEKMGTRHGFWSLREIYRESVTGRSPMCTQ